MPACRRNGRDLPSWPCEFDSRHPLQIIAPSQLTFSMPELFEHPDDKNEGSVELPRADGEPFRLFGFGLGDGPSGLSLELETLPKLHPRLVPSARAS